MSKLIFDTNFIISLLIQNDDKHQRAIQLKNEGIFNNECYVTNLIIQELFTVLGLLTKDVTYVKKIYSMIKDNFIIIDEYKIDKFNDKVVKIYYMHNTKLSFVDSSLIEIFINHREYTFTRRFDFSDTSLVLHGSFDKETYGVFKEYRSIWEM